MKPLLIGQAPGRRDPGGSPALGAGQGAGGRLAALLEVRDVRELFDTVNLLDAFPGRVEGLDGDIWPLAEARGRASAIDLSGRPFVILLGLNVARAFGVPPVAFEWFSLAQIETIDCTWDQDARDSDDTCWYCTAASCGICDVARPAEPCPHGTIERHSRRSFIAAAIVPHTSGVNRFYNDPESAVRCALFCAMLWNAVPFTSRPGCKPGDVSRGTTSR